MIQRRCEICDVRLIRKERETLAKFAIRRGCGMPECFSEIQRRSNATTMGKERPVKPAPDLGLLEPSFAPFNITPNDGYVARMQGPESNRTLGGIAPW